VWIGLGAVAVALAVLALTGWLAASDWLMSLKPQWTSTIFSVYVFVGFVVSAVAAMLLTCIWVRVRNPTCRSVSEGQLRDLATMLLGTLAAGAQLRLFETRQSPRQVVCALRDESIAMLYGPTSLHRLYVASWDGAPIGTMGAVITQGGTSDRKKLIDIGAAGPLAGLVVAIPVLYYGLLLSPVKTLEGLGLQEGNSLLCVTR